VAGEVKETLYASLENGAFGVMTIAVAMGLLVYDGFQVAAVLGRWWWRWWWRWWCRRRQETVGKSRGVFREKAGPTWWRETAEEQCNYGSGGGGDGGEQNWMLKTQKVSIIEYGKPTNNKPPSRNSSSCRLLTKCESLLV